MINTLNLLDVLPNVIEIDDNKYAFVVYPNFEESLCLSYQDLSGSGEKIFVIVIEPGKAHKDDDLEYIEDICEIYTVSNAVTAFNLLFNSLVYNGFISTEDEVDPFDYTAVEGFEELDLDYGEEVAIKPNVDIDEDDYIKIVNKDFTQCEAVSGDIVESTDARKAAQFLEARLYLSDNKINEAEKLFDIDKDENGEYIKIDIDVRNGKVLNYKQSKANSIFYKVCDSGIYVLYDKDWKTICELEGYVPKICAFDEEDYGYGDYFAFDIKRNGSIKNWPKDSDLEVLLNDFIYDAFTLNAQY